MDNSQLIPFVTLPNWIRAAAVCGFSIDPIFEHYGIHADLIHLQEATIEIGALDGLMQACVENCRIHSPEKHFPFVLGETFNFEYLPEIETYISTSENLREATHALRWVKELVNPYVDLRLEEEGRLAKIYLSPIAGAEPLGQSGIYYAESVQPTVLKFARHLLGSRAQIRILRFRHPPPAYAAMYEEYFHSPVAFNQPYDGIEFDRELLDLPLTGAHPALHEQARYLVEQRVKAQPQRKGMAARVQHFLQTRPDLSTAGIESCSKALKLHPRGLQRKLKAEGTNYGELVDELRFRQAVEALQSGQQSLEQLSENLGFADRRSFTRAFKRWSGLSPSQYRKTLDRN